MAIAPRDYFKIASNNNMAVIVHFLFLLYHGNRFLMLINLLVNCFEQQLFEKLKQIAKIYNACVINGTDCFFICVICLNDNSFIDGRGSSIGCVSAWYMGDREFDRHVRQHPFVEFDHEIISTAILFLPLIQLSVTGERRCTKYWQTAWEACPGTVLIV